MTEIYLTVDTIHLTATIPDSKDVLKDKAFGAFFSATFWGRFSKSEILKPRFSAISGSPLIISGCEHLDSSAGDAEAGERDKC
jgi:hypothetical protein